jgi:hypothetical protein
MSELDEPFEARNDLERQLMAAQEGSIPGDEFMQGLLGAQLFMPVQEESHGIKGFTATDKARPLTLETEEGGHVIVLFTSPERAKPFVKDYPGFEGGLLADFNWILEKVGSGYGVALNPGWSVGIDMDPEMVDQMAGR